MIAVDEIFDEHRGVGIESDSNSLKALGAKFRLKLLRGASGVNAGRTRRVDELNRYYFAEVIAQSPLSLRGDSERNLRSLLGHWRRRYQSEAGE
jgi:hypothetical protein